jgi:hypothetical protein
VFVDTTGPLDSCFAANRWYNLVLQKINAQPARSRPGLGDRASGCATASVVAAGARGTEIEAPAAAREPETNRVFQSVPSADAATGMAVAAGDTCTRGSTTRWATR